MKLTRKLIIAIGFGIFVVLAVNTVLRVQLDRERYEQDIERDHRVLAQALSASVELLAGRDSDGRANEVVEAVNHSQSHLSVRWVRDLDARWPSGPRLSATERPTRGTFSTIVSGERDRYFITYEPVVLPGHTPSVIEIVESLAPERGILLVSLKRAIVVYVALFLFCLTFLVFFGTTFVGRPLRALAQQARRISAGDLSTRLRFTQDDEIRELADEMNAMSDRLARANEEISAQTRARMDALEQLRHADRLRTVGELASGIAHELGTPLNVIRARAMMLASGEASTDRSRSIGAIIVEQADRMTTSIRETLDFARRNPARKETFDLVDWLPSIEALVEPLADRAGVALSLADTQTSALVHADPSLLSQAVTNLVVNAIQATPRGGRVEMRIDRVRTTPPPEHGGAAASFFAISIRDDGAGIASEHLARVFEPFFTTKPPGEGTGLGLPISRDIVREHGGFIDVTSDIGKGTTFVIHLPDAGTERQT